ncbi:hypothetical protein [Streptomyces sp. NBC_00347]|uniref:hypothetical protein n=1 Tax=Streptomyces sp. NBC_00347 TaxID=2975721 RepID=UPI002253EB0B|nr:hypothetical protein [Streptomyces sp. NBC_00347]MCX5123767.1 hypothetical protein [Streptomyces sp. NBC_00347]
MDPRDHRTLAGALCADGFSRAHFERIWESLIEQFGAHPDLRLATVELFMQARRQPELRVALAGGTTQGRRGSIRVGRTGRAYRIAAVPAVLSQLV